MAGTGVYRWTAAVLAVAVLAMTAAFGVGLGASDDAAAGPSNALDPRAAALTIVAFGSSSTEGVGASSPAHTYPALLQKELRAALPKVAVKVVNRGIGGEDVDDMMRRLPAIIAEHPDLIVWQTGSNDPLRGVPLKRFLDKTRAGVAAIRKAGIALMLMEAQDCPAIRAVAGSLEYRDSLRALAAELDVPLIRRYDLMHQWVAEGKTAAEAAMMSGDDLHMNDDGYKLLAHAVAKAILKLGHYGVTSPAPSGAVTKGT